MSSVGSQQTLSASTRSATQALRATYRTASLGNLPDPVEELVYISLTRQTHHWNAGRSWELVLEAGGPAGLRCMRRDRLVRLLHPAGFARQKAAWIKGALKRIEERFGELTLEPASAWPGEDLESFLTSLPGISIKSAKCVMMYSMGRQVLPVDTHLRRLATRLGWVPEGLSEKRIHAALEAIVAPEDRYDLHVNAVWHGRKVCTARHPRCRECPLQSCCATAFAST